MRRLQWGRKDAKPSFKLEVSKESGKDEEIHFVFLVVVLDGEACHAVAAYKERSEHQAMKALKRWFSGNESQKSTIGSVLDELSILKLDECAVEHDHMSQLMRLIEALRSFHE